MHRMSIAYVGGVFLLAAIALAPPPSSAEETDFIAYGASAESKDLVAVQFRIKDGEWTSQVAQREPLGFEPAPVVFNAEQRLLYIASLRSEHPNGNRMTSFRVGADGKLTRGASVAFEHGSAYMSLDRTGRFLLTASYFEGHADVYRLGRDGLPVSVRSLHEGRTFAHSIRTTNDNRFAYVPYVKENNGLFQYAFDAERGELRALAKPQAETPAGVGPRHLAYHPRRPFVFFSNEQHLGATSYRIGDDGTLTLVNVCDPGDMKPAQGVAASDVEISRDGKFLFVGLRDFANQEIDAILRYGVGEDGKLNFLGKTETDPIPWGLQLSPAGEHLLVTCTHGETLTAYRITPDGGLEKRHALKWGKMIRDIAALKN